MLTKIKLSQFGGINTEMDSSNAGVSDVRECKNFLLRPLGGLSVPPAWSYFAPGGVRLDLGRFVDFYFRNTGAIVIQSSDGTWWQLKTDANGNVYTEIVADPVTYRTSDFVIENYQTLALASAVGAIGIFANEEGIYNQQLGHLQGTTYIETVYAFSWASGFALKIKDNDGNTWKTVITNEEGGIEGETI